ncbi:nucleoporin Nup186/Nup192/Nup205 [Mucor lusitanicus]|uniref:Uncharacterized protein n=2 Tax=Mucor circinelloides f. lusitanicus TaxID=29924 RepID=A0A162YJ22_MUCCL|nr:nucleoporin Nup186/Nup192/Nup205 [Mucor lusitanicus]OAC98876.1 hypothetical protein MUCCIDRAFT_167317 [Mucor lusitanicus CBS 277.49]
MSYSSTIPTWTEENRSLHDTICQARVNNDSAAALRQILHLYKNKFLMLLDSEPKNAQHRTMLNSNKAYINRISHNVSKDFVTKAVFLSDQLNINEHVAATLLRRATSEVPRVSTNSIDAAVLLYHEERGYLLACLDVILKSAKDASISDQVRSVCSEFIVDLVQEKTSTGQPYVSKLLGTLDELTKTINAIITTGSAVGQVPETGTGKLGDEISNLRIERLGDERIYIVQIIYHITSLSKIDTKDKLTMLEMLEMAHLSDPATAYMIVAMVSALSYDDGSDAMSTSESTMQFIDAFHHRIMSHGSEVPVIKAVIVLQWILYLSDPARSAEAITQQGERSEENIKELLDFSIATDVFRFMNDYLLYFQQPNAKIDTDRKLIKDDHATDTTKTIDASDYRNFNADIRTDFQPFVIHELEKLGILVISTVFGTLQDLKYKEEDTNIPVQTPLTTDSALLSSGSSSSQCHDLQYFLTFLASVFRNRVNDGAVFWNREQGGLNHFTRWLQDLKVIGTVCAAFDFLASITTGDACATHMFEFFKTGMDVPLDSSALFSWGKPLAALVFYANLLKDVSEESNATLPDQEEQLILQFLILLKQCVQYSKQARIAFWFDNNIGAQRILINILNCPTSTRLRAALFDVLAAFCSAWGGGIDGVGREISYQVWKILEDSDMLLGKRKVSQERSQSIYQPPGILQELEAEKRSRVFVETVSVIRLIASAIHSQSKREALISGFRDAPSSIPLDLGKDSKKPGSAPFISLVMDDIFVSLSKQKYNFADARWELTEACLLVMENSIEAFDIQEFNNEQVRATLDRELKAAVLNPFIETTLTNYCLHPGFQVMVRILSGGRIVDELFSIVQECAARETKDVESMPYFKQCLVRSLRILYKILQLQYTFCDILVPYISDFAKKKVSSGHHLGHFILSHLLTVVHMDQLVSFDGNILNRISLLIDYQDQEEICFLSTRIVHLLSTSKLGPNVAKSLSTSKDALAIVFGVSERLSINLPEVTTCDDYEYDINNIPFWLAKDTIENTYNYPSDFERRLNTSVRLALLNLLIDNAEQAFAPTLAEFLLGYNLKEGLLTKLQDTDSNQASLVCLHAILDMLRQGLENENVSEDTMMDDTAEPSQLMIDTHPILAEKCYELIYRLCAKKSLSTATLRYLRNREDFFCKQFNSMSSRLEHNIEVESTSFPGTMVCSDGTLYKTDFFRLRSKLRQRAWLLHSIALELHKTVATKQKNETSKLLALLYGRQSVHSPDEMDTAEQPQEVNISAFNSSSNSSNNNSNSNNSNSNKYQQPLVKMLEFISSLEFAWVDDLAKNHEALELQYFSDFSPAQFEVTTRAGYALYNVPDIYKHLSQVKEHRFAEDPKLVDIETEMGNILSWAMAQNHIKEIAQGKLQCMDAWREVVNITLIECFDLIEASNRQSIIYELLGMLLPTVLHTKNSSGHMLKCMNDVILALVNRLGMDDATAHAGTQQLPVEKLGSVFTGIVNCICGKDTDIVVRGDMYSAMTSFLLYTNKYKADRTIKQLQHFIVDKITAKGSTLLNIMCQDATNGLDVWKTTAYIALDSLNKCALNAGSTAVQLYLIQKNFLQFTIEMIQSDDAALSNLLEQLDAPLLPLYVFEAKMSILLGFAMNPKGAELLYSHRIFDVLGQCQFIKAQLQDPSITEMNLEDSMELSNRYQRLVMPTLELIVAILMTFGAKNDVVLNKAEIWARKQQLALTSILEYEGRPVTLNLLKQLQLVTTIVYFMSCRTGYLKDLATRGISQLHNTMMKFEISEALLDSFIPMNKDESSVEATKIIKFIHRNAHVYKNRK